MKLEKRFKEHTDDEQLSITHTMEGRFKQARKLVNARMTARTPEEVAAINAEIDALTDEILPDTKMLFPQKAVKV